ncbi:MAG: alkaline phosphatase D family protein [Hyphomonas sp.]
MKHALVFGFLFSLAACQSPVPISLPSLGHAPETAEEALEAYYKDLPQSVYPKAPAGRDLPDKTQALTRILVGSCLDEEKGESAVVRRMTSERADLVMLVGDNVYGDRDNNRPVAADADLTELRESFADLAKRPDFRALRASHPMMVAWDDHDYGANDGGSEFLFRRFAERVHEKFWGLDTKDVGGWPGTYYARSFGPEGQRTQIIMLDTRFFRSELTDTDEYRAKGKEAYLPSADPQQSMLGNDQWTWLQNQLTKPADLRLIVSSIQVLPTDGHGWEAWSRLPMEQQRLFRMISDAQAEGVVFVSGDRHAAFLYEKDGVLPYKASELTTSSINVAFLESTDEKDSAQIGSGYTGENFGAVDIDWEAGRVGLSIKNANGQTLLSQTTKFR